MNKNKYNGGNELQSGEFSDGSGLELYDASFRMYDAQLGRFHSIDPLADLSDDFSPNAFVRNNPIAYNDPLGLDSLKRTEGGALPTQRPDGSNLKPNDVVVDPNGNVNYYNGQSWQQTKELEGVTVTSSSSNISIARNVINGAIVVLVADDAFGVGVADDIAIPVLKTIDVMLEQYQMMKASERQKGGGKNAQHTNQKARDAAAQRYEAAKERFEKLRSKPNKSKEDSKELERAKREMQHEKRKMDETGENHSQKAKGSN